MIAAALLVGILLAPKAATYANNKVTGTTPNSARFYGLYAPSIDGSYNRTSVRIGRFVYRSSSYSR